MQCFLPERSYSVSFGKLGSNIFSNITRISLRNAMSTYREGLFWYSTKFWQQYFGVCSRISRMTWCLVAKHFVLRSSAPTTVNHMLIAGIWSWTLIVHGRFKENKRGYNRVQRCKPFYLCVFKLESLSVLNPRIMTQFFNVCS